MHIEEIVTVKISFGNAKKRSEGTWNLDRHPELREAIERVMATGKEEYFTHHGDVLYHIKPRYPLIESAMEKPENQSYLKVSIGVFTSAFHLGVRGEGQELAPVGRDPQSTSPEVPTA